MTIALFIWLVGIACLIIAIINFAFKSTETAVILLIAGIVLTIGSCIRIIGTKEIGVPTTFGKVGSNHYGAGLHMTGPWVKIHEMDGAIKTLDHLDNKCFKVRIANQQTGCAEISVQWRINPKYVDYDYQNYRSFSHLETQLVDRKLFSAVNEALASYNPLATVSEKTKKNPLPGFQTRVFDLLKLKVRDINGNPLIIILNVQLPIVHFDNDTQNRVNQLQQQVALTLIANQEKKTNKSKAEANANLAKKSLTQEVLVSRCLDQLSELIKTHQRVPPGFSCWPNSNLAGVIAK